MRAWKTIDSLPPHKTVLLYRKPDLYPVVGWRFDPCVKTGKIIFVLEEGGPEDDEKRTYPWLRYAPTHWLELPETPL